MQKTLSFILTFVLLVALVAAAFIPCTMMAYADSALPVSFTISDVRVTRSSSGSYMPAETYSFSLTPGTINTAIDIPQNGIPITPGPAAVMTTNQVAVTGNSATVNITASSSFDKPGIYKYQLQQAAGTMPGETYATDIYNVYVYYGYATPSDAAPSVISVNCYRASDNYTIALEANKVSPIFNNTFVDSRLKITKHVNGNMGDRTKSFDFYIAVCKGTSGVNIGDVIPVTVKKNGVLVGSFASITVSPDNAPQSIGFQLKDGETLDIQGLPIGAKYIVSETSQVTQDGYVVSVQKISGNATQNNADGYPGRMNGTIEENNELVYTNTKEDVVTGLFDNHMPYAVLMICASVLAAVLVATKQKSKSRI